MKAQDMLAFVVAGSLLLTLNGCRSKKNVIEQNKVQTVDTAPVTELAVEPEEMFTERDMSMDYDTDTAIRVTLAGDRATVSGEEQLLENGILWLEQSGCYLLSGDLSGTIAVRVGKHEKVMLVMNGVQISGQGRPAIYVQSADKVFIVLSPDSENSLSAHGAFTPIDGENVDAALYSKETLTLGGRGQLSLYCDSGHGAVSKDDLKITGGQITVEASSHALKGNDSVRICNSDLTLFSGRDGIHCEHAKDTSLGFIYIKDTSIHVKSEGDGIDASGYGMFVGVTVRITSGGGFENGDAQGKEELFPGAMPRTSESMASRKGIAVAGALQIDGGFIGVDSADDALHSDSTLLITDGNMELKSGDDGIHADSTLELRGGRVMVLESYEGLEGSSVLISGGEIELHATDDGMNSTGTQNNDSFDGRGGFVGMGSSDANLLISGGSLVVYAQGDGIDSNGTIMVTGGDTRIYGPTSGANGALDYQTSASVSGGSFLALGASGMAMNFSSATQGALLVNMQGSSGSTVTICDALGEALYTAQSPKSFGSVLLTLPSLKQGETYTLTVGNQTTEITFNSLIYGQSNGFGPGGFGPGGQMPGGDRPGGPFPGGDRPNGGFPDF